MPVNMARTVMEQILATGKVTRGWLGVSIQDVTPAVARAFGLAEPKGALVGDVTPDSPAATADLQRGGGSTPFVVVERRAKEQPWISER
ncbi:MAG: S1C family serine protease [Candidatus Methylomirabilia bacterium]